MTVPKAFCEAMNVFCPDYFTWDEDTQIAWKASLTKWDTYRFEDILKPILFGQRDDLEKMNGDPLLFYNLCFFKGIGPHYLFIDTNTYCCEMLSLFYDFKTLDTLDRHLFDVRNIHFPTKQPYQGFLNTDTNGVHCNSVIGDSSYFINLQMAEHHVKRSLKKKYEWLLSDYLMQFLEPNMDPIQRWHLKRSLCDSLAKKFNTYLNRRMPRYQTYFATAKPGSVFIENTGTTQGIHCYEIVFCDTKALNIRFSSFFDDCVQKQTDIRFLHEFLLKEYEDLDHWFTQTIASIETKLQNTAS